MPADMHVNRGLDPKLADDDVRFRTTYYFRTFDYCWDFNAKMRQSSTGEDFSYRSIIPKTDTLYRYRMTGKASSTFSRIRFESGVLKAAVLDPFGTQVSFSEAADGFIVRGASEVKEAAERSAEQDRLRAGKLEQLKSLTGYYLGLDPNSASEVRTAALEALKKALEDYRGASPAPSSLEGKQLQDAIGAVEAKTTTLFAADKELSGAVAKLKGEVDAVASYNELGICRIGEKVRKGFQIMGPEGLKTYDQDDRLVIAMSSSAKPLIETLQEYAGGRHIPNLLVFWHVAGVGADEPVSLRAHDARHRRNSARVFAETRLDRPHCRRAVDPGVGEIRVALSALYQRFARIPVLHPAPLLRPGLI